MSNFTPDSLDDLLSGPQTADGAPRQAPPSTYQFTETCPKCRGTGRFVGYSGRTIGQCFACKGAGKQSFKTSPETRAAQRQSKADRGARRVQEWKDAFKQAEPEVWAWINEECDRFGFAAKMLEAIATFGSLTEGQLTTCKRLLEEAKARKAARAERIQSAPSVASEGVERLKAAFDKAIAYTAEKGLRLSPRLTFDGVTISPAKANSANPGALYVKAGGTYLGKIAQGKFFASRECGEIEKTKVLAFVDDPAEAAKVYGQTTGTCCICGATLRSEWKHRGIGPVCATKFGW